MFTKSLITKILNATVSTTLWLYFSKLRYRHQVDLDENLGEITISLYDPIVNPRIPPFFDDVSIDDSSKRDF